MLEERLRDNENGGISEWWPGIMPWEPGSGLCFKRTWRREEMQASSRNTQRVFSRFSVFFL